MSARENPRPDGRQLSAPAIIRELYTAPTLYPGEDPALFERLLEELAIVLEPADLTQWLLIADLRAVILDEGRYRKMLAMIMSPKELIEPEESEQETQFKLLSQAMRLSTIGAGCMTRRKWKIKKEYGQKSLERFKINTKPGALLKTTNAPELERRAAVSNFQETFGRN